MMIIIVSIIRLLVFVIVALGKFFNDEPNRATFHCDGFINSPRYTNKNSL